MKIYTGFNKPLTSEAKYWLGFILADGCISLKKNNLQIGLNSKDQHHLEKFLLFLKATNKIYVRHTKNNFKPGYFSSISIGSKQLVNQLISFGITIEKTITAKPLQGLEDDVDFWRGVIDGDGVLCLNSSFIYDKVPFIGIGGTEKIVQGFADFCYKRYKAKSIPKISIDKRVKIPFYFYKIKGVRARNIVNELYYDGCVALDRRMRTASLIKEVVNV